MGEFADGWPLRILATVASAMIVLLNIALIVLVFTGA